MAACNGREATLAGKGSRKRLLKSELVGERTKSGYCASPRGASPTRV
jgi:hypothetical protein